MNEVIYNHNDEILIQLLYKHNLIMDLQSGPNICSLKLT